MLRKLADRLFQRFDSAAYWRERYRAGGNSGAGSYGRLAEYKAEFINGLIAEKNVGSVIEFGFGDGSQASMFNFPNYTGIDVVPQLVGRARAKFSDRTTWHFMTAADYESDRRGADLAMSLDVIYHLIENAVFERYMASLFAAADRYVLIYSSDDEGLPGTTHVRHRRYSDWVLKYRPDFVKVQQWENPYAAGSRADVNGTSFAAFTLFEKR